MKKLQQSITIEDLKHYLKIVLVLASTAEFMGEIDGVGVMRG